MKWSFVLISILLLAAPLQAQVNDSTNVVPSTKATTLVQRAEHTPDSVFIQRLHQLPYVVELPYNPVVRRYILRYLLCQKLD